MQDIPSDTRQSTPTNLEEYHAHIDRDIASMFDEIRRKTRKIEELRKLRDTESIEEMRKALLIFWTW